MVFSWRSFNKKAISMAFSTQSLVFWEERLIFLPTKNKHNKSSSILVKQTLTNSQLKMKSDSKRNKNAKNKISEKRNYVKKNKNKKHKQKKKSPKNRYSLWHKKSKLHSQKQVNRKSKMMAQLHLEMVVAQINISGLRPYR